LLPSVPTRDEWALLSGAGMTRAVLPGEQLFRRGDEAQSMFLIDTGQVRLSFEDGLADKMLGPGQYFGELSVFVGEHLRFASATVETECVLFEISSSASRLKRNNSSWEPCAERKKRTPSGLAWPAAASRSRSFGNRSCQETGC